MSTTQLLRLTRACAMALVLALASHPAEAGGGKGVGGSSLQLDGQGQLLGDPFATAGAGYLATGGSKPTGTWIQTGTLWIDPVSLEATILFHHDGSKGALSGFLVGGYDPATGLLTGICNVDGLSGSYKGKVGLGAGTLLIRADGSFDLTQVFDLVKAPGGGGKGGSGGKGLGQGGFSV